MTTNTVTIVANTYGKPKNTAAELAEYMVERGYDFVKARVSKTDLGHEIELTFADSPCVGK